MWCTEHLSKIQTPDSPQAALHSKIRPCAAVLGSSNHRPGYCRHCCESDAESLANDKNMLTINWELELCWTITHCGAQYGLTFTDATHLCFYSTSIRWVRLSITYNSVNSCVGALSANLQCPHFTISQHLCCPSTSLPPPDMSRLFKGVKCSPWKARAANLNVKYGPVFPLLKQIFSLCHRFNIAKMR